ncbi:hypothetical protein [Egbenema bharatensis]|uniref:hypothetical protein n=1 Tax=Egbenema bharatensis TaxID=3463334 RepID=UPI003A889895
MHSQAKSKLLIASLFVFSIGGTFALFGSVPMLANLFADRSVPNNPQDLPHPTEADHSIDRGKVVGASKRVRPVLSRRTVDPASPRSAL